APGIQRTVPQGYTIAQFMGHVFGPGVRTLFFLSSLAALSLAVGYTFTGLRQWFSQQLGMDAFQVAIVLGIAACLWVIPRGLPGALIGDVVKVALIAMAVVGAAMLTIGSHVSMETALATPASLS